MDISFFIRQPFGDAARFPSQNAALAFDDGGFLTYEELANRANRYANVLLDLGVGPGDRVGILLYNCTEYWIAYFAITRISAIAVRLNFRLMAEELEYALTDSGATVLLANSDLIARIEDCRATLPIRHYIAFDDGNPIPAWVKPWSDLEAGAAGQPAIPLPPPETPAMLMYTSGTTGQPKGALWSHGTTTWWASMQVMEWGLTPQTVTMVTGPMYHIGALENYALPTLAVGGRVVVLRSRNFNIRQTLEIASKQQVTCLQWRRSVIAVGYRADARPVRLDRHRPGLWPHGGHADCSVQRAGTEPRPSRNGWPCVSVRRAVDPRR